MITISTIVATGPGLMMAMAAVALFIVYHSLSRVRHALVWSAAFAVAGVRWTYVAVAEAMGPQLLSGLTFDLLGVISMLLFAEGFRLRAGQERFAWVVPVVGAFALVAMLAVFALPPMPLRSALVPVLSIGLLGWSGSMVTPRDTRRSIAEVAVVAMLCSLAIVHLAGATLALAAQMGLIGSPASYVLFYTAALDPASAATGLFALLLIAFDFSAELRRLIHTDPLTGVLNRLGFEYAASLAIDRSRGRARTLSLAIADIDGFKGINDRHGHVIGDATLVGFARHLAASMERGEAVGRIGGEEFALLLPGTDGRAALQRIETVRDGLVTLRPEEMPELAVTASFGVAERLPNEPLAPLIERADKALYRSKREGRNRTTLAGQEPG